MRVYLARHGQSTANEKKILNSDPKVKVRLTTLGVGQSQELAEKLKDVAFEAIYTSEFPRVKETAEIVNKYHSLISKVDPRLNDNRSGFNGRPRQEFLDALNSSIDKPNAKFNDGESLEEVKRRTASFMEYLKTQNYNCVLVVTSDIIVMYFYGILHNLSHEQTWDLVVDNGNYIEVDI